MIDTKNVHKIIVVNEQSKKKQTKVYLNKSICRK